jgi:predicted GIY-YIG superfamily endonuclease
LDKYYIGFTQELLSSRLERHNSGFYGSSKYTVIASGWEIYLAFSERITRTGGRTAYQADEEQEVY